MKELQQLFHLREHEDVIIKMCQDDNIDILLLQHHQILAGIIKGVFKSAKFYLRRILGNASLAIEELMTISKQVETSGFNVITPAHFFEWTTVNIDRRAENRKRN